MMTTRPRGGRHAGRTDTADINRRQLGRVDDGRRLAPADGAGLRPIPSQWRTSRASMQLPGGLDARCQSGVPLGF